MSDNQEQSVHPAPPAIKEVPAPSVAKPAPPPKPPTPAKAPKAHQPNPDVSLAIVATVVIVLGLAFLVVYAYLKSH